MRATNLNWFLYIIGWYKKKWERLPIVRTRLWRYKTLSCKSGSKKGEE